MSYRRAARELDLATWPTVAYTELPAAQRAVYLRREQAVQAYAAGIAIRAIEKRTKVTRAALYRLLERALRPHLDGRVQGFRGLVPGLRLKRPGRRTAPRIRGNRHSRGSRGATGAFAYLLWQHPSIQTWFDRQVATRLVLLEQQPGQGPLPRVRLRGLETLHAQFLQACRAADLTASDYPFNTEGLAVRTLSRHLKGALLARFGTAARRAGAQHLKGWQPQANEPPASAPYEVVEFDGYRIDARLKVLARDSVGLEHVFETERVWLLAIIDVFSRAILGYHIALTPEYSRYDLIRTVQCAIEPHRARTFTIPGLRLSPRAGFPSSKFPELGYACWERLRFDNAKANLAADSLAVLTEVIGCITEAGPFHSPDERPYVERFFGAISSLLSHRLPGYTGSHPKDLRRRLADPKGRLQLLLTVEELEDLIELAIAEYNATPHAALGARTPLEALELAVRGRHQMPRSLAEPRRRALCLLQTARRCIVRGDLARGIRPHINLYGVRHTNAVLAERADLIGAALFVYMNVDDMREVRAFYPDRTELGVLSAQGSWRHVPHTLSLRREALRLKARGQLAYGEADNPIEALLEHKRKLARASRRHASALAAVQKALRRRDLAQAPAGPDGAIARSVTLPDEPGTTLVSLTPPERVKKSPPRLSIGTGHTY